MKSRAKKLKKKLEEEGHIPNRTVHRRDRKNFTLCEAADSTRGITFNWSDPVAFYLDPFSR